MRKYQYQAIKKPGNLFLPELDEIQDQAQNAIEYIEQHFDELGEDNADPQINKVLQIDDKTALARLKDGSILVGELVEAKEVDRHPFVLKNELKNVDATTLKKIKDHVDLNLEMKGGEKKKPPANLFLPEID